MANMKPGERKLQILQALAQMLESPKGEKITTAALAARLDVSEAALYRHFASKAQMYEGLIEFIESSVFTLANRISQDEADGGAQAVKLVEMLLAFAEKSRAAVKPPVPLPKKNILVVTGGGSGTHQVYIAGVPHHRLKDASIVDHLVELIEKKALEIEAAKIKAAAE